MSTIRRTFLAFATIVVGTMLASAASAQIPRYRPPGGSPLPPALDYFRRDVGILDPYNTFVAPRRQLMNQLQALSAREQYDFQAAQSQISSIRQSVAAPTGVGAGYMNYSHYYPNSRAALARPR
jgi:hypothetical protein